MRIHWKALGCVLCILGSGLAVAPARGADQVRIAVVDGRRALISSNEGRAAEKALKALMEKKKATIGPEEAELKRLEEEFQNQQYVLSPSAAQGRKLELVKRQRDLERRMREAQDDLELEQRKLMQPMFEKVEKALRKIGKEKGFSVILEKSSPGVLFTAEELDITDLLIQKLNED